MNKGGTALLTPFADRRYRQRAFLMQRKETNYYEQRISKNL